MPSSLRRFAASPTGDVFLLIRVPPRRPLRPIKPVLVVEAIMAEALASVETGGAP